MKKSILIFLFILAITKASYAHNLGTGCGPCCKAGNEGPDATIKQIIEKVLSTSNECSRELRKSGKTDDEIKACATNEIVGGPADKFLECLGLKKA